MKYIMPIVNWMNTPSSRVGIAALVAGGGLWAGGDKQGAIVAFSAGVGAILAPDSAAFQKAAADVVAAAPTATK